MTYRFERVLDGISKYIDREIYSGMNDFQEFVARLAVGRVINNSDGIKAALINNGVVRTFGIIDSEGMVDIDTLAQDIKREIERKGKLVISVPMFGTMTFVSADVDAMLRCIKGEEYS